MPSFQNIVSFTSLFLSGLIAGLMFSYSCSVNIGLKSLPDTEYLKAMQVINLAILNPVFLLCFTGLLFLLPIHLWSFYFYPSKAPFYLLLTATGCYFIGVFMVTMLGNVPLNNQLATFDIASASADKLSTMRLRFEPGWNKFHLIRTISAIAAFALMLIALLKLNTKTT